MAGVLLLACVLGSAAGATLQVDAKAGSDAAGCGRSAPCKTLARAFAEASAGDEIRLAPGVYAETDLKPEKANLAVVGPAPAPQTWCWTRGRRAGAGSRGRAPARKGARGGAQVMALYDAAANMRIRGLTFRGGRSWVGGCVLVDMLQNTSAGLLLEDVVFEKCHADGLAPASSGGPLPYVSRSGGGVYAAKGASPTFRRVTFRECRAWLGGGAVWVHDDSAAVFEDCLFEKNFADNFGGAFVGEGRSRPLIRRSKFIENESPYGGAADSGLTSTARFEECLFERNAGTWSGGAIYHYGDDRWTVARSVFRRNRSGGGGGGAVAVSTTCAPVYEDCTFEENTSESGGGHVTMSGASKITVRRSSFRRSTSTQGGAFYNRGETTAVLEEIEAAEGVASDWGGGFIGLWGDGNSVTIRNSSFSGFSSKAAPGGFLRMQGDISVLIEGSRIANCSSAQGTLQVSDHSVVTLRDTVVSDNAAVEGGALAVYDFAAVSIEGGGFLRNAARERGGALFLDNQAKVTVRGATIAENEAAMGGGVYVKKAAVTHLVDSQVLRNRARYGAAAAVGPDFEGDASTLQFNGTTFAENAASIAGGVLYFDNFKPILGDDSGVVMRENGADWGPVRATRPQRIVVNGSAAIAKAPGEDFVLSAHLIDALGQLVTSTYPPLLAELRPSEGLVLSTLTSIQVFKRGVVEFEATYYVDGSAARNFTVAFDSEAGRAEVRLSVLPCAPGYAAVESPTSFRCVPCAAGTYNLRGDGVCQACPSGATCPGKTLILPERGFWVDPASLTAARPEVFRCPSGFCCPGGKCELENACAEHRTGVLCGDCVDGYSDWAGRCARCEDPQYALLLIPLLAAVALVVGCWFLSAGLPSSGKLKSAIFFVQSVSLVMNDDVGVLFSNLSWDVLLSSSLRCPFAISPVQRTLLGYWIPAFAFAVLCAFVALLLLAECLRSGRRRRVSHALQRRLFIMAFQIASIAYIAIGNTSIKYLDCVPVGGQRVLRRFPSVNCASDEYTRWLPVAWIMMVGYVFALPVALSVVVLYLSRKGTASLYSDEVVWKYGSVFACYRPPWKFYEVVVMARRIVLIILDTAFASRDNSRSLALFLAAVFFVTLHGLARPYRQPLDNVIETLFLTVLMLTSCMEMVVSAAFIAPEYNVRGVQYTFNAVAFAVGALLIGTYFLRRLLAARRSGAVGIDELDERAGYAYLAPGEGEEEPPASQRSEGPPSARSLDGKRDSGEAAAGRAYAPPTARSLRRRNSASLNDPAGLALPPAPPSEAAPPSARSVRSSRSARTNRSFRSGRPAGPATHRSASTHAGPAAPVPARRPARPSPRHTWALMEAQVRALDEEEEEEGAARRAARKRSADSRDSDGGRALPVLRSIWEARPPHAAPRPASARLTGRARQMTAPPPPLNRSASSRSLRPSRSARDLSAGRSDREGEGAPAPATSRSSAASAASRPVSAAALSRTSPSRSPEGGERRQRGAPRPPPLASSAAASRSGPSRSRSSRRGGAAGRGAGPSGTGCCRR
eukprot:tig00001073_g6818.t1